MANFCKFFSNPCALYSFFVILFVIDIYSSSVYIMFCWLSSNYIDFLFLHILGLFLMCHSYSPLIFWSHVTRLLCVQSRVFFSTLFSFYTGFHLYYGGLCGGGRWRGGGRGVGLVGRGVGVGTCMRLWRVQLGHPWDNG